MAAAKRHKIIPFIMCFLLSWQNGAFFWQVQLFVTRFMRAWAYILRTCITDLPCSICFSYSSLCLSWHHCSGLTQIVLDRWGIHRSWNQPLSLSACRCIPYTCIIISRKHWKHETTGGADATQSNKDGPDWKDPGRWQSRLASIEENKQRPPFWEDQPDRGFLFIGTACIQGCFCQKTRKQQYRVMKISLTLRCTWEELAHSSLPLFSLHLFIYPSISLSHIVAPLWSFAMSPFRMQRRGPCEFRPLALKLNSEDGVIWELPGGCQLALGWADQVAGMVDACPCQAPTAFPSVDICCV